MKKIVLTIMLVLFTNALVAEITGCDHAAANLLINDNTDEVTLGARTMLDCQSRNKELLDMAAYILSRDFSSSKKIDMHKWLIEVIGQSGDGRYKQLIHLIVENGKVKQELQEQAKTAYEKLPNAIDSEFLWAQYDYSASKEKILKTYTIKPRDRVNLGEIKRGDSVNAVYQKIGAPSTISVFVELDTIAWMANYRVRRSKTQSLQLLYKGAGILHIDSVGVFGIYSLLPAYNSFNIEDNVELLHGIYTDQVRLVRRNASILLKIKSIPEGELDAIAYRAWMGKNATDLYMIDAMTILCKLLYHANNPRYRSLFEVLATDSSGIKLRRFAESMLPKFAVGDFKQFQPESVAVEGIDK